MDKKSLPFETSPRIPAVSPYTFRISVDRKIITIYTGPGEKNKQAYRVDVLRRMESSKGLPEPVRAMAREALTKYGLLSEEAEEKEIPEEEFSSETITTIQGIKIYQSFSTPVRRFFAWVGGRKVYGSLSALEKKIKGDD